MRTSYWKQADARGPKPVRILDLRVEPHRNGDVFFIREFVEYDNGQQRWRRRTGETPGGIPFTYKFKTEVGAQAEISSIHLEQAVHEADAALRHEIGGGPGHNVLKNLWKHTAHEPGQFPTAERLVSLFREQQETVAAALDAIRAGGSDQQPKNYEVELAFQQGHRSVAGLVAWWHEEQTRPEKQRVSAELKDRKVKERAERREREEDFLRAQAAKKASDDGIEPPLRESLSLVGHAARGGMYAPPNPEAVLDNIVAALRERPYLQHVLTRWGGYLRLYVSKDRLAWTEWDRYESDEHKRQIAYRAEIADAFGKDPKGHWGKVRGDLLKMLKPDELDMRHRKDVQEALQRARAEGKTLVVIAQRAFLWDEEAGKWRQREVVRRDGAKAPCCTLWLEGPIRSANHGRIIVLPYIKEDGTKVGGYTRNAPYEGKAEPRAEPKVIRFAVYDELGRDDTWDHEGKVLIPDGDEGDV